MPQNNYQKLARFSERAMLEAASTVNAIEKETEAEHQRLLAEGRAAIRAEQTERLIEGRKALGRETSRAFSTLTLALRETLLRRREEIVSTLTDDVRGKLVEFSQSDAYLPWLLARCRAVAEAYPTFTIQLAERDIALAEALRTALSNGTTYTICADPTIHLGGARFSVETQNLLINETLDERLARSREAIIKLLGPVSLGDARERNQS